MTLTRTGLPRDGIVTDPRWWATSAGYEFWAYWGSTDSVTAIGTANDGLDGYGWTYVNLAPTEGTAGDLLSSADNDPTMLALQSAGHTITSPRIFGSYDHALVAARFLGYMPTKLTLETRVRIATATASQVDETTTFWGLAEPSVNDAAAAGCAGAIRSGGNGSTFFLTSDNGSDAGAAIDTSYHLWVIVYGATNTEWFMDGTSQGTITTEADIWPQSFKMRATSGTNDFQVTYTRIYYS